jgi:Zn-dependent M28 family amino/carboxypeptidase
MLAEQLRHPTMSIPDGEAPEPGWPVVMLKESGAAAIFAAGGLSLETERALRTAALVPGGTLAGVRVTLKAPVVAESSHADNIAGLVRGSDPAVADEVVIVSAHNDHIGILKDGRINHGADDNASGTATLLAAAEILATGPAPRRSVLFLSVSGEEKGLWGSNWWCEHPTVPLERCIANINIDMVGRNDPDAVGATPSPEHPDYNTMVARAVELGPAAGLHVTWTAPAAGEDKVDNYYERSDHYNFAAKGIPVVFFFSGLHEDYHRPTDTLDKLNRDKLYRMVALVKALVTDVADAGQRPAKVKSGGG